MQKEPEELPQAANQDAIEIRVREMLGPSPEEAAGSDPASGRDADNEQSSERPTPTGAPELSAGELLVSTEKEHPIKSVAAETIDLSPKKDVPSLAENDSIKSSAPSSDDSGPTSEKRKSAGLIAKLWHNKTAYHAAIAVAVIIIGLLATVPSSRYFMLNGLGVRASVSLNVVDKTTGLPLRNVKVAIGSSSGFTDRSGDLILYGVRLGPAKLNIDRTAFASTSESLNIGFGANDLGRFELNSTGAEYRFSVRDFLSGKPVSDAEAISGEASALSSENGEILLALDPGSNDAISVTITAAGFREEQLSFSVDTQKSQVVNMVPAKKHVFVAKRSGTYNLYKIDVDGKNEQLLLKGTGSEREQIALVPNQQDDVAALVSSRDDSHDSNGYLLDTLSLVNVTDGSLTRVAQSERIQIIGWFGERLVYAQISSGGSASDPNRQRLVSYDYKTYDYTQIATSNYFNDILAAGDKIYYAPSAAFLSGSDAGLFETSADGSSNQKVVNSEVWNIFRTDYSTLVLSVRNTWSSYDISSGKTTALKAQPKGTSNRIFIANSSLSHYLWVDTKNGKNLIMDYDPNAQTSKEVYAKSGIGYPIWWLSDTSFVYRVHTGDETADYVMNIDGGAPHKITNVYNTSGSERWYYY